MKTSAQWWAEVKADPAKFNNWLVKQYRGEVTAAHRIRDIVRQFAPTARYAQILERIAVQEEQHAEWVLGLLKTRGVEASLDGAEKRYWAAVKDAAVDFSTAAAVGAHAEEMRLERIRVIVADPDTPADVREVFGRILPQEVWHASAFTEMAGPEAMASTKYAHEQGRALLGLVL